MTDRTAPAIDFYFDFVSPFGWIAAEQIGALARRHQRVVRWHPFLLKVAVVDTMGLRPILETPLKGAYAWHDAHRSASLVGLTISPDVRQVFSPVLASRAVLWARDRGFDVEGFVLALYRHQWREGGDISDVEQVLAVVKALGFDEMALSSRLDAADLKAAFRSEVDGAIAKGVFGSPTVLIDGEPFWGADRLGQVDRWLTVGEEGWRRSFGDAAPNV